MKAIDFNSEITHLLTYYERLIESQDKTGEEMELAAKGIIEKKDSDDGVSVDDFVGLEVKSFMVNLYNQEIVKVSSSIKTMYRLFLNMDVKPELSDKHKKILDYIVNDKASDFIMYVDGSSVSFKDSEVFENIKNICSSRVDPASIDERFDMLKSQYESFLKLRNSVGNGNKQKADA